MNLLSGTVIQSAARLSVKLVVVAAATVGGGALVSSSVFASLTAVATASTAVDIGTLKLNQAATGASGGFATAITAMAPGDSISRFVTLTNGGTLDAITPTIKVADTGTTTLTTSAANGLQVAILNCTVAWTAGACTGGTSTTVLSSTPANTLLADTSLTLPSNAAAAVSFLKITISLPTGSEVTTNGTLPGGTVQGVSTTLNWTITETQRTATSTNS